jgi:hypothetical protein
MLTQEDAEVPGLIAKILEAATTSEQSRRRSKRS